MDYAVSVAGVEPPDRRRGRHDDVAEFPSLWGQPRGEVWDCLHAGGIYRGCRNIMLYLDSVPNVEVGVLLDQPCPLIGRVVASALPAGPEMSAGDQLFQTIRTRMTSQITLTTPPMVAIRPRSTVGEVGCPGGRGAAGPGLRRRGAGTGPGCRVDRLGCAATVRRGPPSRRPRQSGAGSGPAACSALIARRWSRMISTSSTIATTNSVPDTVSHGLLQSLSICAEEQPGDQHGQGKDRKDARHPVQVLDDGEVALPYVAGRRR